MMNPPRFPAAGLVLFRHYALTVSVEQDESQEREHDDHGDAELNRPFQVPSS